MYVCVRIYVNILSVQRSIISNIFIVSENVKYAKTELLCWFRSHMLTIIIICIFVTTIR